MGAWHSHTVTLKWAEVDHIELCKPGEGLWHFCVCKFPSQRWLLYWNWPTRAQGRKPSINSHLGIWAKGRGWLGLWWSRIGRCRRKEGGALETDLKWEEVMKGDSGCWGWKPGAGGVSDIEIAHWRLRAELESLLRSYRRNCGKRLSTEMKDRLYGGSSQALELDGVHPREEYSS